MKVVHWFYKAWVVVRETFKYPRTESYLVTNSQGRLVEVSHGSPKPTPSPETVANAEWRRKNMKPGNADPRLG